MSGRTVRTVIAEPLDLELNEPFTIATGSQAAVNNVLVEVRLADGTRGLGEAAPLRHVDGHSRDDVLAAVERCREHVIGEDAGRYRVIAAAMAAAEPTHASARCGVEMAVLDALTRSAGLPLWAFFGGAATAVTTDMTVTAGDVAHAVASARAIVARGMETIKIKVGALAPAADVERVLAIAGAAPGARLIADANGGYDSAGARAFLEGLAAAGVELALFEQPVAREPADAFAQFARASETLVCADESVRNSAEVAALAAAGVRAVNIKLMKSSVVEAWAMVECARGLGMALMIGGMVESRIAMGFSAHFAAGLGGFDFVDLDTPLFIAGDPFSGGYVQRGAVMDLAAVAAGHGLVR